MKETRFSSWGEVWGEDLEKRRKESGLFHFLSSGVSPGIIIIISTAVEKILFFP